jgi:metallo-beta-lactamase family protein
VPVRAEVVNIGAFSAHADYEELSQWLSSITPAPSRIFLTHGEPAAASALQAHLRRSLGWECHVPKYLERVALQ